MFHVKDAEFNPTGRQGIYGGYQSGSIAPAASARWATASRFQRHLFTPDAVRLFGLGGAGVGMLPEKPAGRCTRRRSFHSRSHYPRHRQSVRRLRRRAGQPTADQCLAWHSLSLIFQGVTPCNTYRTRSRWRISRRNTSISVNGRRLHCVVAGEGRPVLLIPGWPQTGTRRHVMQALAAAGFQAIAVDPPGIGDSDKPAGGYDTGSIGAALHAMMAQLGHERYQLVGHDIGMWIGYAMASDFPQAVERPVLTEAVIPGTAPPPPIFVAPEENIFLWHFMFNQLADLPETLTGGVSGSILAISSTAGPIGAIGWRRRCISLLTQRRAACAPDSTITGRSRRPCGKTACAPPRP